MEVHFRCVRCHYDLTGLPCPHHCPECGFAYDEHFRCWGPRPMSKWDLAVPILFVLFFATGLSMFLKRMTGLAQLGTAGGLVCMLIVLAVNIAVLRGTRRGPTFAISPLGIFIRGIGKGTVIPWGQVGRVSRGERTHQVTVNRLNAFLPSEVSGVFDNADEAEEFCRLVGEGKRRHFHEVRMKARHVEEPRPTSLL